MIVLGGVLGGVPWVCLEVWHDCAWHEYAWGV